MADKPSEKEDEYFARVECEKRKKLEEERLKRMSLDEKRRMREAHYMKCPKCGADLLEIDRHGVKVDKCCDCGGLWLDSGELELVCRMEQGGIGRFFHKLK